MIRISAQVNFKKFNKRPLLLSTPPCEDGYSNIVWYLSEKRHQSKKKFNADAGNSISVCTGKEKREASAITKIKYILNFIFSVLPKFYEKMNKRQLFVAPISISAQINNRRIL